jgi:hypothetical protein
MNLQSSGVACRENAEVCENRTDYLKPAWPRSIEPERADAGNCVAGAALLRRPSRSRVIRLCGPCDFGLIGAVMPLSRFRPGQFRVKGRLPERPG